MSRRKPGSRTPPASAPPRPKTPSPTSPEAAPPSRFPWPPVLYLAAAAAALALHIVFPLPWFSHPFSDILFAIGLLAAAGGAAFDLSAILVLARAKTTVMPTRESRRLVTSGPFAVTRNPIYLGNTLILLGVGLASGIAWFLPLALLAAAIVGKLAIAPEERHLDARFGKAFRDYRRSVRRWI